MQYLKLDYELITDTKITSNEFRIYTYLLSRYNKEVEGAFPSHETISQKLNIGIATVKRSVKNLVSYGYMVIEKAKSVKGNYNVYKKLKHLILDHQEPKEVKAAATEELKVVKKDNISNKSYKTNKKPAKTLRFTNYTQRDYNFEQLENDVLGWR